MSGRGTERRRLGGLVGVRLPPGTAAAVAIAADAAGLSAGAWIRACLVDRLGTEAPDAVPVAARRPPRPPASRHVIEIARLREAAAELGGALTKAAVRTRTDGAAILHAEIEATIPGVRRAVLDLDALKRAMLAKPPP